MHGRKKKRGKKRPLAKQPCYDHLSKETFTSPFLFYIYTELTSTHYYGNLHFFPSMPPTLYSNIKKTFREGTIYRLICTPRPSYKNPFRALHKWKGFPKSQPTFYRKASNFILFVIHRRLPEWTFFQFRSLSLNQILRETRLFLPQQQYQYSIYYSITVWSEGSDKFPI